MSTRLQWTLWLLLALSSGATPACAQDATNVFKLLMDLAGTIDRHSQKGSNSNLSQPSIGKEPKFLPVSGYALGASVNRSGAEYRSFKCNDSEAYVGLTFCVRTLREQERRGPFTSFTSLLHDANGRIHYVNRFLEPAFWTADEAVFDIERITSAHGEAPRLQKLSPREGFPAAIIAIWGTIELVAISDAERQEIAERRSSRRGILVDFQNDLTMSAAAGLPIFRLQGGTGYVWIGTFGTNNQGKLRFFAADPRALGANFNGNSLQPRTPASTASENATPNPTAQDADAHFLEAIARLTKAVEDAQKEASQKEREIAAMRETIARAMGAAEQRHKELLQKDQQIALLSDAIQRNTNAVEEIRNERSRKDREISNLQSELKAIEARDAEAKTALRNARAEATTLKAAIKDSLDAKELARQQLQLVILIGTLCTLAAMGGAVQFWRRSRRAEARLRHVEAGSTGVMYPSDKSGVNSSASPTAARNRTWRVSAIGLATFAIAALGYWRMAHDQGCASDQTATAVSDIIRKNFSTIFSDPDVIKRDLGNFGLGALASRAQMAAILRIMTRADNTNLSQRAKEMERRLGGDQAESIEGSLKITLSSILLDGSDRNTGRYECRALVLIELPLAAGQDESEKISGSLPISYSVQPEVGDSSKIHVLVKWK